MTPHLKNPGYAPESGHNELVKLNSSLDLLNIYRLVQYNIQSSILITNNVAFEVIKVDVTPHARAIINEPDSSVLTNQVFDLPALTIHRLRAVTSLISDNLKYK